MHSSQSGRTAPVLTLFLLAVGACRDSTAPEQRQTAHLIRFAPATNFTVSSRSVEQGSRTTLGGCRWHHREVIPSGQTVSLVAESLDTATCQWRIARGERTGAALQRLRTLEGERTSPRRYTARRSGLRIGVAR